MRSVCDTTQKGRPPLPKNTFPVELDGVRQTQRTRVSIERALRYRPLGLSFVSMVRSPAPVERRTPVRQYYFVSIVKKVSSWRLPGDESHTSDHTIISP